MGFSFKTYSSTVRRSKGLTFTNTLRNNFVKKAPISLKFSVIAFVCRSDINGGNDNQSMETLNVMGVIGS